jgi:hypothetical protein
LGRVLLVAHLLGDDDGALAHQLQWGAEVHALGLQDAPEIVFKLALFRIFGARRGRDRVEHLVRHNADDDVHRSVLGEEADLLVIEFDGPLHSIGAGRKLHDCRNVRFFEGACILGRIDKPGQESVTLVDAAKAPEEVEQFEILLALHPKSTLLKPLVEKVDALSAVPALD